MQGKLYKALGVTAIAVVVAAMAFGGGALAEKAKAPAACKSIKVEADCKAREDCSWVSPSISKKTGKQIRPASCRSKPKSKKTKT